MLNDDNVVTSVDTLQMGTGANWVDGGLLSWRNLEMHLCLSGQSREAHCNQPFGQKHPPKLSHISSALYATQVRMCVIKNRHPSG